MVIVGFFPCDAGCVDLSATGRLHSVFSMPGAVGLSLAAMVSAMVFRADGRLGRGWQVASFALWLIALASGPFIGAELVEDTNGLVQRVGMWMALAWMAAVSTKLVHVRGVSRHVAILPVAGRTRHDQELGAEEGIVEDRPFYSMRQEPDRVQAIAPEHAAYWHALGLRGYLGGPFADRSGGLVTFEADSVDDAERVVAGDPFVRDELLESSVVNHWVPE